jgi:hypothetical protein
MRCGCGATPGYHADGLVGLQGFYSRRLQEQSCRLTADVSFAKASEHLHRLLGAPVTTETLRLLTHRHGRALAQWQTQDPCVTTTFAQAAGQVEFTIDAVKVNTGEKGWKDLKIARLQKRPAGLPKTPSQWQEQRLPAVTAQVSWAKIASAKNFCKTWRKWTRRVGVTQAADLQVVADGAGWIWKSVDRVLTGSRQTLDIYHACQHLARAGQRLYGEGTEQATAFFEQSRLQLLRGGWSGVCEVVAQAIVQEDTPQRRKVLDKLVGYFAKHTQRLAYAQRLAQGEVIGSGAVEGQAKTLGLRLKGRGSRWKFSHVHGMASLVCVRESSAWPEYWKSLA